MLVTPLEGALIILAVAFVPPVLLALSVANAKRYRKEPVGAVFWAFIWGAIPAAGIALVVNTSASQGIVRPYVGDGMTTLVVALVVAPIVEEGVKPLVLFMGKVRRNCDERADGIIYGAVAGLGFSATENLFYELAALADGGQQAYIMTAVARTLSSTLLHATATAVTGYGIARYLTRRIHFGLFGVFGYYLIAVLLHAAFNFLATIAIYIGILPLIAVAMFGFWRVRRNIAQLSMVAPHGHWAPLGPHQEAHGHEAGWIRLPEDENGPQTHLRRGPHDDEPERWYPTRRP